MKAYKVEILVIDHDQLGQEGVETEIESVRYPNRCLSPVIMGITEADIGEWHDDHPLNLKGEHYAEYARLFPAPTKTPA